MFTKIIGKNTDVRKMQLQSTGSSALITFIYLLKTKDTLNVCYGQNLFLVTFICKLYISIRLAIRKQFSLHASIFVIELSVIEI